MGWGSRGFSEIGRWRSCKSLTLVQSTEDHKEKGGGNMKFIHSANRVGSRGFSSFFILQGGLLVLLGILIVLFPALLTVMVATFFILIGLMVLGFGLSIRKIEGGPPRHNDGFLDI
jgi:hypothetical protein